MDKISVDAAAVTHIGSAKSNNEDNYYINGKYKSDSSLETDAFADKGERVSYTYAVCDGIGGESYGELASLIAVATLAKYEKMDLRQTLDSYISTSNEFIYDLIKNNREKKSGTTLALLDVRDGTAVSVNIGNSRVYFCRKGRLYLMSEDHFNAEKKTLTQCLGVLPMKINNLSPYSSKEVKLKKDDVFMLCTDGLSDVVSDEEIVEFLSVKDEKSTVTAKKLITAVREKQGKDDVTAVIVKVTG